MRYTVTREDIDLISSIEWEGQKEWKGSTDSYKKGAGKNGDQLFRMGVLGEIAARWMLLQSDPNMSVSEVDTKPLKPWQRAPYDLICHSVNDHGIIATTLVDVKTGGLSGLRVKQDVAEKFINHPFTTSTDVLYKVFMSMMYHRCGSQSQRVYSCAAGDMVSLNGWEFAETLAQPHNAAKARGGRDFMNYEIPQSRLRQFKTSLTG